MVALGVPAMTLELGASKTFDPELTRRGLKGIRNILMDQNVIPGTPELAEENPFEGSEFVNVRATRGGFVEMLVALNEDVTADQPIAIQRNAFGARVATYYSPEAARVLSVATDPMREPGSLIARLLK